MDKKSVAVGSSLAILCGIALIASMLLFGSEKDNPCAEIYVNGELFKSLPLSENAQITVETELGRNVVTVENGEVSVTEADCPDKVCVRTGALSGGNVPIICLPHRLEIRIADGSADTDAKAG